MTNTKFRKRALLSSVAMLLVALVALGSATFAWYEANMTVSSSGMTFSTNAASGLEIVSSSAAKTGGAAYQAAASQEELDVATYSGSTSFYGDVDNLQPASADKTGAFWSATGKDATHGQLESGKSVISDDSTNYIEEKVYFKTTDNGTNGTGTVKLTGITINTANTTTMNAAVRVVVYSSASGSPVRVAEYRAAADTATAQYFIQEGTYTAPTGGAADAYVAADKDVTQAADPLATAKQVTVSNVSSARTTANYCMVRVYLDGFEESVFSQNATAIHAATDILTGINMTFEFVPGA